MDTPKTRKNRVHLDPNASGAGQVPVREREVQIREAEPLLRLGAEEQREWEERGECWVVMLNPEGIEFCVQ